MKKIMFVMFAISVMWLASCSNPSDSVNNWEPTVSNGGSTQVSQGSGNGNGNQTHNQQQYNSCDMGGYFNLQDWEGKIYVNNQLPQSTHYDNRYEKINWDSDAFETNSNHKVHLYITKNENKLVVEKNNNEIYSGNNQWFEIQSVVKTNNNRIDVTLKAN